MRNEGGGFAEIDDEVTAVLAFVISHATFLVAQDDETGRCPKVVFSHQSLLVPNPQSLATHPLKYREKLDVKSHSDCKSN